MNKQMKLGFSMRKMGGFLTLGAVAASALLSVACNDPTEGKTKATVSSAVAVASAPAADTAAAGKVEKLPLASGESKLTWVGSKVTGKHDGGFEKFTGTIELTDGKIEQGKVTVEIDMTSVTSDAEQLTGHLKNADFFEVEKFPTAKFESTSVKAGGKDGATHTITGNLTLRGETKSIEFPATINLAEKELTVKSEFSINRKDFGIVYTGKADDLIRDDVLIRLDLKVKRGE